jgi:hypothetical protein
MTTPTVETSQLIYTRVKGLRTPQVKETGCRYITLFIFIHKGGD